MASIWRLNEDRVEFERVTSAVLDADPEGTYVIQQPDNTFRLRIGNAPTLAVGERFTVAGVEFDATEIECARPVNIV